MKQTPFQGTAVAVKSDQKKADPAIVQHYVKDPRYKEVHVVTCGKCGYDLCLEVMDPKERAKILNKKWHPRGLRRIELSNGRLLASRARLDGVMGYQCVCGNDTRMASVEEAIVPVGGQEMASAAMVMPHVQSMVDAQIRIEKYEPDVEQDGNVTRIETFKVEQVA